MYSSQLSWVTRQAGFPFPLVVFILTRSITLILHLIKGTGQILTLGWRYQMKNSGVKKVVLSIFLYHL